MAKVILISLLLTAVYSWDELKRGLRGLLYAVLRGRELARYLTSSADKLVGTLIVLATFPIGLSYLLLGSGEFFQKLPWVGLGLMTASLAASGAGLMARRLRYLSAYDGVAKIIPLGFSIAGLFSPVFGVVAEGSFLPRKTFAKLALLLSLVPLVAFSLRALLGFSVTDELLPNLEILLRVLVGALILRIAVEFLETYFHLYRLEGLFAYFRVVLGIALGAILLWGAA